MRQLPLALAFDAEPTFDSFYPGANAPSLAQLRALQMPAAPIYLWGPQGAGKTHLLRALGDVVRRAGGAAAFFAGASPAPWSLEADVVLAVVDGCEALDGERQREAFRLFVDAQARGVQIAAAGRVPPVDLPLRDDLRTRLGGGDIFAIQPLDDAQARAALRGEFERRGIFVADEVMDFLLNRFARDLKNQMAWLDRLDSYALSTKRAVSLALLRRMLEENDTPCG